MCELVEVNLSSSLTDGVILVDPEYLKDRKGSAAWSSSYKILLVQTFGRSSSATTSLS